MAGADIARGVLAGGIGVAVRFAGLLVGAAATGPPAWGGGFESMRGCLYKHVWRVGEMGWGQVGFWEGERRRGGLGGGVHDRLGCCGRVGGAAHVLSGPL